ncbi:MAG: gluconate permease, partial [Acinetobacter sp.]|nr:gluconate permease [Acinetobacter sp.]
METVQGGMLLIYTVIAIIALVVMIAKFRIYPFLVLIIVSLGLALAVGMPVGDIVESY